jgi:predicted MFS family arabinose efflux permease
MLANAARTEGLTAKVLAGLAASAAGLFLFAMTDAFWLAVGLIAVIGFAMSVTSISSQVLLQNTVEDAMRGRVMSLFGISFRGVPAIGALIMGKASTHIGLQWPIAIGALACLAAWTWAAPRLRRSAPELERMAGA